MQTLKLRQLAFSADAPRSVGQPEGGPPAAAEAYLTIVREWLTGEPKEPGISRLHDPDRGRTCRPFLILLSHQISPADISCMKKLMCLLA